MGCEPSKVCVNIRPLITGSRWKLRPKERGGKGLGEN